MANAKRLSRSESRANTRSELLQTAKHCFAQQGYGSTSLEQVAEKAGFSRGAMHYNFSSKDELFTEVMRICFAEDIHTLECVHEVHQANVFAASAELFQAMSNDPESYMLRLEFWLRALRDTTFQEQYLKEHRRYRHAIEHLGQISAETTALLVGLYNGLEFLHLLEPNMIPNSHYQTLIQQVLEPNTPRKEP